LLGPAIETRPERLFEAPLEDEYRPGTEGISWKQMVRPADASSRLGLRLESLPKIEGEVDNLRKTCKTTALHSGNLLAKRCFIQIAP